MAADRIAPQNSEERLVFAALTGAWLWYGLGALYIVGPVLGVVLCGLYAWRRYTAAVRPASRLAPIPAGAWVWVAGMLAMLVALWVAHVSAGLGAGQTIKSTIGWMKGWALLAAFPLVGACLSIRPALVIRATMWLALQTLLVTPILIAAALAHLPQRLFVSPLQAIGGPGPEFFAVQLYLIDPSNGALRWQFFAPWAPAAGMIGDMIFVLALWEPDRRFKAIGLVASVVMCLMTMSRMAILFLVFFPPVLWLLGRLARPGLHAAGALLSLGFSVAAETVIGEIRDGVDAFRSARADSTRVREALGRIAVDRWWNEARVWGHGIVERGPHHVEFMPIGSHHTWFGLLFVKGAVGVVALALPMLWTFCEMILLAQIDSRGRLGLSILLMLVFYSAGENLEILAYLFWPGLVLLGDAFRAAAVLGADLKQEPLHLALPASFQAAGTALKGSATP